MKKEKEENRGIGKKHIIIFLVGVLLLSGAVSYAYFTAQTKSTGAGVTTVSQTVSYEGTELVTNGVLEFNDTGILPGHQNISSVSVTATGVESLIYNLNWTGTNTLKTPLTYTVYKIDTEVEVSVTCNKTTKTVSGVTHYYEECTENNFDALGTAVGSGTIGTYETQTKIPLVINEEITATREGTTIYYYVVLEYPNLNESQNYDMGGSFNGVVNTEILGEKEMPVVTLSEEYTEASNGWYSSVVVTARATNSNNTVSSINSCITTEEECTPESDVTRSIGIEKSVTLNESNKNAQKVCFQGVDSKGTKGLITCSNSYLIDNTSTTTSITLSESSVLGDNNWYQAATLNITGNNEVSGISSIKYCITSNDTCEPTTTVSGSSASVTLSSSATGQKICATSTDNKGDSSDIACSNLYNVDTVDPTVEINDDYTVTSDSITINVTGSDTDSKIASYSYTLNGSAYSSCTTATCTFTGLKEGTEYTVGVSVTDLSGRSSDVISSVISTKSYKARNTIIANNTVAIMPSITGISTDTSNTLYTVADDDGTSYVFRGNPSNNWVNFGGYYWRIIRINGGGSIRMIYNGTSTATNTTGTQINGTTYAYNTNYNDNAYVGFMYGTTGASTYAATHANTNNSTIKTQLDSWYSSSGLSSYADYIDTDASFCNDRQTTTGTYSSYNTGLGYGTNATSYAPWGRLYENNAAKTTATPSLKCTNASNDLFTMASSDKGNKKLTNPVGLITSDEVVFAGGFYATTNTGYYLYTNQAYWTMSPYAFYGSNARVFGVSSSGSLSNPGVYNTYGVRPVINLRSDVTLSGTGLVDNPYTVS